MQQGEEEEEEEAYALGFSVISRGRCTLSMGDLLISQLWYFLGHKMIWVFWTFAHREMRKYIYELTGLSRYIRH
jgi:hypothetical protein